VSKKTNRLRARAKMADAKAERAAQRANDSARALDRYQRMLSEELQGRGIGRIVEVGKRYGPASPIAIQMQIDQRCLEYMTDAAVEMFAFDIVTKLARYRGKEQATP
jgi:hypothetical protein